MAASNESNPSALVVQLIDADDDGTASNASGSGRTGANQPPPATKKKVYHCEVCDKKYATMTNIYKHMRSHQLYLCSLCMRTFAHEHQIKEHRCPQGSVKTPQCHVCFKYLSNSWSLTRHMKIHAHELDESGNYTKHAAPLAAERGAAPGAACADASAPTTVVVTVQQPQQPTAPPQQQQLSMLPMQGGTTSAAATAAAVVATVAAADSSSGCGGVVRVHEVDISEVTSCSLATSCSSELLRDQAMSGELSMMSAEHSQDYHPTNTAAATTTHVAAVAAAPGDEGQQQQQQPVVGSGQVVAHYQAMPRAGQQMVVQQPYQQPMQVQQPAIVMMQPHQHHQSMASTARVTTDADTTSPMMDDGDGGDAADEDEAAAALNGAELPWECRVCARRFKNELRLLKHQRLAHCGNV